MPPCSFHIVAASDPAEGEGGAVGCLAWLLFDCGARDDEMHLCCPFDARRGTLDFAHLSPWCIRMTTILYEGLQEEQ